MFRRKKDRARMGNTEDTMCLTDPTQLDSSSAFPSDSDAKPKGLFSRKKKSGSKAKQSLNAAATLSSSPNKSNSAQSRSSPKESTTIPVPAVVHQSHFSMEEKGPTYDMAGNNNLTQTSGTSDTSNTRSSPQSAEIFRQNEQSVSGSVAAKSSISHTMSESSASSAMGSDIYINSLENRPPTSSDSLLKTAKDFPVLNLQSDRKVKEALSREVGRNRIPAKAIAQWSVRVDEPKWDDDEERYKYKIRMTKNAEATERLGSSASKASFNEVTTTRSLQDFVWLERALLAEYHGGLICPLLSLNIYFASMANTFSGEDILETGGRSSTDSPHGMSWNATKATSLSIKFLGKVLDQNEAVNKDILAIWLSDVINGVRGDGEVALRYGVDILQSEALETFLFRHTEALNGVSPNQIGINQTRASSLGGFELFSCIGDNEGCYSNTALSLSDVIKTPFALFDACTEGIMEDRRNSPKRRSQRIYSSGATGVPGSSFDSILSESDFDDAWLLTSTPKSAAHSELLEAEREFIASSTKTSSDGISRMQSLVKHEEYVGRCWQNLATALSGLFAVEKDIETAHIGDQIKSNKKKQPFRKLRKSAVNEVILGLAQGKVDRAKPGLTLLGSMLNAYYSDLNSVVPSLKEIVDAIKQLNELDEAHLDKDEKRSGSSFEQLKSFIKNKVQSNESSPRYTLEDEVHTVGSLNTTQSKALQRRVLSNEKLLKHSITSLCRESALRRARMAWWYFKTEAKQAANVHATAVALRQALSIDADTAMAMKERRYAEDETKDNAAEIDLVKRILDLGKKNFSLSDNESSNNESNSFAESSQAVLNEAIDHVSRWDANIALTILQAAGVEDAEVTIDETSRELRHVRKYSITLRESVEKCLEAVSALSAVWNSDSDVRISKSRREFWAAMSTFFSGKVSKDLRNVRVLANAGIDTQDRGGWLGVKSDKESPLPQRRRCGEATKFYLKKRDCQAGILISRISKLLNEYERRLEGIESFVYMHIVGIQLEKHCSVVRSKSLSAWEKRTDISTAINVATKKKIPKLVEELRMKLDGLPQVSHTTVIKAKENHLASKTLKSDLHKLANRRLGRAQDVATERVIAIVSLWAKHEESVAMDEVKALGEAVQEVEMSVQASDVDRNSDELSFISSIKKEEPPKKEEPNPNPKQQEEINTSAIVGADRTLMI